MADEKRESMADRIIRRKHPEPVINNVLFTGGKKVVYDNHEITLKYAVATAENEWGYNSGAYLVTSITLNEFDANAFAYTQFLQANVMADLLSDGIQGAEAGATLTSRYLTPNDGIIFQIT